MKTTKFLAAFPALVLCLGFLSISADAQKRKPAKRPAKPAAVVSSNFAVKSGAEKVSTQLKNLTRFIYNFGNGAKT